MEMTIHRSFIRGANLRRWMSRLDAPSLIRNAQSLFDKTYSRKVDDHPMAIPTVDNSNDRYEPEEELDSAPYNMDMPRLRWNGVFYTRYKTHNGNSGVMWYPEGDRSRRPVPGQIRKIECRGRGTISFVVEPLLPANLTKPDPFASWPEFRAQTWSSAHAGDVKIELNWVASQMIWCELDDEHCVVIPVSRVRIVSLAHVYH
jgi:hypothetical protein